MLAAAAVAAARLAAQSSNAFEQDFDFAGFVNCHQ